MPATLAAPSHVPTIADPEQRLDLFGIGWARYVSITDALGDQHGLKSIYLDGGLTFLTLSRRHDWHAERLAELFKAVATGCGVFWEDSGSATYRREAKSAGLEGDKVFYVGANAERMLGPQNIDLTAEPPPDVAIEVEVTHPADDAMIVYGRLGVPEVWRFDLDSGTFGFWSRREDETYAATERSPSLPPLMPEDVLSQMRMAGELGAVRWNAQLIGWVRDVLMPRGDE